MKTIELNLIEVARVSGGHKVCQCRDTNPKERRLESLKGVSDKEHCETWCCDFVAEARKDAKYFWYNTEKPSSEESVVQCS